MIRKELHKVKSNILLCAVYSCSGMKEETLDVNDEIKCLNSLYFEKNFILIFSKVRSIIK